MEFDSEERYACAALFTLALHQSQVEAGNEIDDTASGNAWGQPAGDDDLEGVEEAEQKADVAAATWAAFWGWDCCGPNGLLDQLYLALDIPPKSWSGLKRLPGLGGKNMPRGRQYADLVSSYIKVLDPSLASISPAVSQPRPSAGPAIASQSPEGLDLQQALKRTGSIVRRVSDSSDQPPDAPTRHLPDFLEGMEASDSDSDLEQDLASAHLQRRILRHSSSGCTGPNLPPHPGLPPPAVAGQAPASQESTPEGNDAEPAAAALARERSYSKAEALSEALQTWQGVGEEGDSAVEPKSLEGKGSGELPGAAAGQQSSLSHQATSAKALGAVWTLLEACITHPDVVAVTPPPPADKAGPTEPTLAQASSSSEAVLEEQVPEGRTTVGGVAPVVRWYDARSRQGLHTVAAWLRVPWRQVLNCETLLVRRLLLPHMDGPSAATSPWERSLRAAKIGAATLTIGALFALTGGVAAPAIAGGVGAAIGLAGGSAAVATGVSSFLGTAAGGAVIASTVGAAGIGLTAPHVANRIGNIREFGFLCLGEELLDRLAAEEEAAAAAAAPADSSAVSSTSSAADLTSLEGRQRGSSPAAPRARRGGHGPGSGSVEMTEFKRTPTADPLLLESESSDAAEEASSPVDSGHITFASAAAQGGSATARAVQRASAVAGATKDKTAAANPKPAAANPKSAVPNKPKPGDKAESSRWSWKKAEDSQLLPVPLAATRSVDDMRMSLTIGVSGWISQREDFQRQWVDLARRQRSSEVFCLVWESKELRDLNTALVAFAASQAGQEAAKWVITHFFFTGLVAALAWPALIYSAVQLIDTSWSVALQRAQLAGRLLAHKLAAGAHGGRPVVLVGFSMGARLVFHCLLELCRLKAKGIVEHACLLGMPVALREERWAMARSVVAGRLINGFSRKDWLLAVVYRGANGFVKDAAGLCPAPFPGVENVNLTSIIHGHFDYIDKSPEILDLLNLYD